jgi:dipeptidyl aminopeptidase/acylaminoacyl peptidase
MSAAKLPLTIEDLVDIDTVSDAQLSPDGALVAFVMGKTYKADKHSPPNQAIYLLEVESRQLKQFTSSGSGTNKQPRWSPDGLSIAFVSNRQQADEAQLYTIDIVGGEADALTDLRGQVAGPEWLPDASGLCFLYSGKLDAEKVPERDPIVVDADPVFQRVWLVERDTGHICALTPESCHIHEYALSPDGRRLLVLMSDHPNPMEGWYSAQLHVVNVDNGEITPLCRMPNQIGRLAWSPDSQSVAFVAGVMSDEGNAAGEVYVAPANGGEARCVSPDIDESITWIDWRDEGILYGSRQIDSTVLGWIDPRDASRRLISKGAFNVSGQGPQVLSAGKHGTFATVRQSFTEPPNIYLGRFDKGSWSQLSDLSLDLPPLRVENRHWQHNDGTPVHGFLVYPPDYQPGKRYPLFANVHGGPSWGYVPGYAMQWARMFSAMGCFVLMPNPRGSWGRGHAYQSANVGDLGGGDWQDINAGVDAMIEEGIADPDRLAVGGWSYGGYLTCWAVTQTDRFRCAIAGASITSYESNYGVVLNREWQSTMFGSKVYDDYELHRSRSPMAHVSKVKTPTLLVHGMEDVVAPPQQSIEFYIALKHFSVPTELVLYPREPHGFQEYAHRVDLFNRMIGWVDRYLLD